MSMQPGILLSYTVKITFWFEYFYLLDGAYKQNIYLLERENFAPMQMFALPQVVANYLNDASRYIYLVERDVFLSV